MFGSHFQNRRQPSLAVVAMNLERERERERGGRKERERERGEGREEGERITHQTFLKFYTNPSLVLFIRRR